MCSCNRSKGIKEKTLRSVLLEQKTVFLSGYSKGTLRTKRYNGSSIIYWCEKIIKMKTT